jgi:acid phosphatase type 7
MHAREMADAMNRVAGKLDPDFALLGGDLAYANDVDAMPWVDWLQSWTRHARTPQGLLIPMIAVIGNHEVAGGYGKTRAEARYYYDLFDLPEDRSNFATDFGQYLSILALDSHHTQSIPEQTQWLGEALKAREDQRFLFTVYHYPAYGTTKAPKDGLPCDAEVAKLIRAEWVPLFERYGVTAVFENDHHTYKRTHRLRGHKRDDANGILYLGDGCWGVVPRAVPAPGSVWYLARAESLHHLWHVTLESSTATFEAVDVQGNVFDRVTADRPRTRPVHPGEPVSVGD